MKTGKLLVEGTNCCENYEWEDLNWEVDLTAKFKTGYFKVKVENFGWRSLSGSGFIKAEKLTKLLIGILPNTDCTFKVYNFGKGLAIQNYHHDSPTGNEWYYTIPISETIFNKGRR